MAVLKTPPNIRRLVYELRHDLRPRWVVPLLEPDEVYVYDPPDQVNRQFVAWCDSYFNAEENGGSAVQFTGGCLQYLGERWREWCDRFFPWQEYSGVASAVTTMLPRDCAIELQEDRIILYDIATLENAAFQIQDLRAIERWLLQRWITLKVEPPGISAIMSIHQVDQLIERFERGW